MATIRFELPDQLAERAKQAGLLSPERFEEWLREQLRSRAMEDLDAALARMEAGDDTPCMSPEEVAEEIRVMRAERRAAAHG